ncbi:MAG: cytochrome d ubiquinol oxidase subunit II, partial [Bacteroidetes bacterium]|nr:cytochrome d ubiquinol oxidase subunit II [Bacteroidota bacterium]
MFESLSYPELQHYWWIIVAFLGAALVFLMFVQGGQTLIRQIGRTGEERTILVNTIGRKWELTFTTLVTFGGAFFASFPLFYSTSFGGAYWIWMLILLGFILQAVSFEFRKKPGNVFGRRIYELFLLINGILATILIGTALGTFFTGSAFSVDGYNLSRWEHPA